MIRRSFISTLVALAAGRLFSLTLPGMGDFGRDYVVGVDLASDTTYTACYFLGKDGIWCDQGGEFRKIGHIMKPLTSWTSHD